MSVLHFVASSATFAPMLVKAGFHNKIGCASDLRTTGERSAYIIKSDTNAHCQHWRVRQRASLGNVRLTPSHATHVVYQNTSSSSCIDTIHIGGHYDIE
jgi:hypothetical protein